MSARAEYNAGDLVEAVKGDTVIRGRLRDIPGNSGRPQLSLTLALTTDLLHLAANGYTVTVVERATPPLPKEVGLYVSTTVPYQSARIVKPAPGGSWVEAMTGEPVRTSLIEEWYRNGTLARLEPAPVTARRVLDRVRSLFGSGALILKEVDEIAAEFGVTND